MRVNIPQFNQVNVGNALGQAEQIKGQRLRNEATSQRIEEQDNLIQRRAKAAEMRKQIEATPDYIDALEKEGMYEQAAQVRNNYLNTRLKAIDVLKATRNQVNAANYDKFRYDMIQSGAMDADMLPVDYSDEWFRKEEKKNIGELKKLTRRYQKDGIVMTEDLMTQDGKVIWKGGGFESAADKKARTGDGADGTGAKFSYKAADDSAMGRQAERLFGGIYDPVTKQFSGLDAEKAQRVQAVHTRATELFIEAGGGKTHAQAIREAAGELRIPIEDPANKDANDPLGIRSQFGGGDLNAIP